MINRATSQLYPPGSTFKTIVAAAALETGDYQTGYADSRRSQLYACPEPSTQLTERQHRRPNGVDGKISLQDALAYSSNTAFAQLGRETRRDDKVSEHGQEAWFRQLDHH